MADIISSQREWLNANLVRAYPLADTTGGAEGTIPSKLLVDGFVLVETPGVVSGRISTVSVSDIGWSLSLTLKFQDTEQTVTDIEFRNIIFVSFDDKPNAVAKFMRSAEGYTICGSFTIGDAKAVSHWAGDVTIPDNAGELSPAVLHNIDGLVMTGLKVGDTILTGEVELVAGPGIDIKVEVESNSIQITNTRYELADTSITSDTDILTTITEKYGSPIKSIAGVLPDENGNINIIVPTEYSATDDYVTVTNSNSAAGTLVLSFAKDPCLALGDIESAADNLQELNERAAILDSAVKNLDSALNRLATQMSRLS